LPLALPVTAALLIVDGAFFVANLWKIADGGWLPLTFAALLFIVMVTWRTGVEAIRATLAQPAADGEKFLADLKSGAIPRVEGTTIFLTRSTQRVSRLVMNHARFVGALPRNVIALGVFFEDTPRVRGLNCTLVEHIGEGLWHVIVKFGFFEIPDVRAALSQAQALGHAIDLSEAKFVGSRDLVVSKKVSPALKGWRMTLFAFLYRNSAKVVDRFNLEPERVVEIARQIEI
jgi:KUP system potassium uptake protein